jgi:hypothetical protein
MAPGSSVMRYHDSLVRSSRLAHWVQNVVLRHKGITAAVAGHHRLGAKAWSAKERECLGSHTPLNE